MKGTIVIFKDIDPNNPRNWKYKAIFDADERMEIFSQRTMDKMKDEDIDEFWNK